MSNIAYGYVRVSTQKQKESRQIENIKAAFPNAVIIIEKFTGTKMERPMWNKLMGKIKTGDTIIFDELSRMSRSADDGFETYKRLYDLGVNLVFLKESTLNTEHYRQTAQIAMTGTDVDCILMGINEYLMVLAQKQIKAAFESSQHEVDFLHLRTREGLAQARLNGKRVGTQKGDSLVTKKSIAAKELIKKYSRDFDGTLPDAAVLKIVGVSRNSYYKYKRQLKNV